jgi:hypothetical protein
MKIEVNENGTIQLEQVYNPIVIKTNDGVEFNICQRDYGIEVTCNGETKYLDESSFGTKVTCIKCGTEDGVLYSPYDFFPYCEEHKPENI